MGINSEKFRYSSAYRNDAGLQQILFGFDKPLLEVELLEMQDIQNELRKTAVRNLLPSGFTELVSKNFSADPIIYQPISSYTSVLNAIAIAPMKAVVNGYTINISGNFTTDEAENYILLNLGDAPYTGTRDDLIYLEVWLEKASYQDDIFKEGYIKGEQTNYKMLDSRVNEETTRRAILKYDIKIAKNVDFDKFPDGFGYTDINNYSPIQATIDGKFGYFKNMNLVYRPASDAIFKGCEFYKDYNLYVAGRPDYTFTTDVIIGKYIFALPMFRLKRRNQAPYSLTNFNGSRTSVYKYQDTNSSKGGDLLSNIRPDKLCYDVVDPSDLVDLRRSVSVDVLNDYYLNKGLKALITGDLQTKDSIQMRRVQFGRSPFTHEKGDGLIMHTSFDNRTIIPDELDDFHSESYYEGETPKYRDSVCGYGLYVDGKSSYTYSLDSLTSHTGMVDFYMQPYYDGYDDVDQTIFTIYDNNDNPVYQMKKVGNKLIVDIYLLASNEIGSSHRSQIVVDLTNTLMFARRIYHIRFSWTDSSSVNRALVYLNGTIVGETQYMGSSLKPVKITIGSYEDYNVEEHYNKEDSTDEDYWKDTPSDNPPDTPDNPPDDPGTDDPSPDEPSNPDSPSVEPVPDESVVVPQGYKTVVPNEVLSNTFGNAAFTHNRTIVETEDGKSFNSDEMMLEWKDKNGTRLDSLKSLNAYVNSDIPVSLLGSDSLDTLDSSDSETQVHGSSVSKDNPDEEDINYGFILEELSVYRVAYEQNVSDGVYNYISNSFWPNIPNDFIANKSLIYPSFNSLYMNYSDNDIAQKNTLSFVTIEDGKFIVRPPYRKTISSQPVIYKLGGEYDRFGKVITLRGTWELLTEGDDKGCYAFTPKESITKALVQYTVDIPRGNGGEDLPNEILAAGLVNHNDILEECGFARLYTTELREVSYLNPARVSASVDKAYDRSTNRDTRQCYARMLYYHQSGNGTNHYEIPSILYGMPVISVMNATNRVIKNVICYPEPESERGRYEVTLETNVAYGDVIEFCIALGGWTFDYETQTKTLVANIHKTKLVKVVADGLRNEFIIPCYEVDDNVCHGGVIKSVCNMIVNEADSNGDIVGQRNEYACYIDNEMYPQLPDRDEDGNMTGTYSHQLCRMDVDETSFNTPFLKITLEFTPSEGQVLTIPVLISYQPMQSEVLSIWYKYVPYQGILDKTHKKLKRLTDWKYFITTLGSGNDTLNINQENVKSLNNVVNRLPGGNSFTSLLTGEKILFNKMVKKDANYELRFLKEALFTSENMDFDDAFFELDSDMEVYRMTSGFQDEKLKYTFNSFKAYLPDNMKAINKYTGMASLVVDEKGQILLFVIGCLNNGNISEEKSVENVIYPIYGDLFKIPDLPTTLQRK